MSEKLQPHHRKEIRYLGITFAFALGLAITLTGFNLIIDPYRILNLRDINGLNNIRMEYGAFGRRGTALHIMKHQPKSVILGASSAEVGFDPDHPAWRFKPVFNLGLSGANLYEIQRYLEHASSVSPVKEAVISIVPSSINAYLVPRSDFSEERLGSRLSEKTNSPLSSPISMYHLVVEFLAPAGACLMTDEAGYDCTV